MSRLAAGVVFALCAAGTLPAQDTLPPAQGGTVRSLGLPLVRKPYLGLSIGLDRLEQADLTIDGRVGYYRDLTLPTSGLLGWSLEGYAGAVGVRFDAGARALLLSNLLRLGVGVDYSVARERLGALFAFNFPVRRGGMLGHGSHLRLDVVLANNASVNLTAMFPIRQPHTGSTRPGRDHVLLHGERFAPLPFQLSDPALDSALAQLREHALWIGRFTTPSLGRLDGDAGAAIADATAPLRARLAGGWSVADEFRAYHVALRRVFDLATADTGAGGVVARQARQSLLHGVLFPYNRLLGQKKQDDTTRDFAAYVRGVFARWLMTSSGLPAERHHVAIYAFHRLLEIVEEVRAEARQRWEESRLGWLPLQLALEPEDYDEQEELDSLVSQAVGVRILHGNRVRYVHNQRFQVELVRSIGLAEDYHVLWIHDFAGLNEHGEPDRISLFAITQAYLHALRNAAARYDSTGQVPVFMVFLDQHYFDRRRSRQLLAFLEDPLGRRLDLPAQFDSLERDMWIAQEELRQAVNSSRLLTTERAYYGDAWLRGLMKVHVSVTNPADPSFRSRWVLPLIGLPDDAMRDHRKLVVWDVSEDDPYRGWAMYTGAGVGEHYVGPSWEDRAIMLQGPSALSVRADIRELLASQGVTGNHVPHVLRPRPLPSDYERRVRAEIDSMDRWGGVATRAVQLHNGTGYAWKRVNVAKATIFNLTSPGGVLKSPDSLWLSEFLASLLAGAALRGTRVVLIAPSKASAPSSAPPQVAVMHAVLSRVLALRYALEPAIEGAGGAYRLALYDPRTPVDDIAARITMLRDRLTGTPFLRDLYSLDSSTETVLENPPVCDRAAAAAALPVRGDSLAQPKLHYKGFLYVSREPWERLIGGTPLALGLHAYLEQRARQICEGQAVDEEAMADAMMRAGAVAINPILDTLPLGERPRWAFFLMLGSANQDNRSLLMDGEASVLVSNWTSLLAVPDLLLLSGVSTWIDEQTQLDRLLPPPSGLLRSVGRLIRYGL